MNEAAIPNGSCLALNGGFSALKDPSSRVQLGKAGIAAIPQGEFERFERFDGCGGALVAVSYG